MLATLKPQETATKAAWESIKPCGKFLLIRMRKQQEKIGSVYISQEAKDNLHVAQPVAQVVAMGPDCYREGDPMFPSGPWCKVGDWIVMKPYAGQGNGYKLKDDDAEYRHIYCDSFMSVIESGEPYLVERFI